MILTLLSAIGIIYAVILGVFATALFWRRLLTRTSWRPRVSIIVPARNEEKNIGSCLNSLAALCYPPELLDIIIVDDNSDDRTPRIVGEFVSRYPHMQLITAGERGEHLKGKTGAIARGVDHAGGEVLFFTDADCLVPGGWIEETLKYYVDEKVGLVAGFTELSATNVFASLQALDWFTLFSAAAAAAALGFPVTAVGNNLSIRKSVYDAVGGYGNIDFSVTEDLALVQAATSRTPTKLRFPIDKGTLVESAPCASWREWYHQRKRWFVGGRKMKWGSQVVLLIVVFFNALLLWTLATEPFVTIAPWLGLKLVADSALVFPALRRFHKLPLLRHIPVYQLYLTLYVFILTVITSFHRSVRWKNRDFNSGGLPPQKKKALIHKDEG